ncbi:DUF1292 domain-containing protein [Aerococcaceae bacterium DSM 111020]|nr:DUF1292 domain-containing protein [Aerococcaceae bacterium DSM 111020]
MPENNEHNHEHSEDAFITLVDEQGNEALHQVLFTFDSEDFGKSYVILFPVSSEEEDEDENIKLQAFSYEESDDEMSGQLHPIETEEEWDMVEEVLNTFIDENE